MKIIPLFAKFEYYKSIDTMPIFNWFKVQETNDLTYFLHEKRDCTKKELSILEKALTITTNEYIDTFGVSDKYKKILQLKIDIHRKEIALCIHPEERTELTFLNVLKAQLKEALMVSEKSDTKSVVVHASKYVGGGMIDTKKMTVQAFYSILDELKKEVEASHRHQ